MKGVYTMERYDYLETVTRDVLDYIKEEIDFSDYETLEDLEQFLNKELWTVNSVTGNGSGSYTFNTWVAEENLCHNLDLLAEACEEFGDTGDLLEMGAEACDVTIRCYLLRPAIAAALEEVEDDFEEAHNKSEEDNDEE
jgi:hypothetical protein